jgi:hypothetical protein
MRVPSLLIASAFPSGTEQNGRQGVGRMFQTRVLLLAAWGDLPALASNRPSGEKARRQTSA